MFIFTSIGVGKSSIDSCFSHGWFKQHLINSRPLYMLWSPWYSYDWGILGHVYMTRTLIVGFVGPSFLWCLHSTPKLWRWCASVRWCGGRGSGQSGASLSCFLMGVQHAEVAADRKAPLLGHAIKVSIQDKSLLWLEPHWVFFIHIPTKPVLNHLKSVCFFLSVQDIAHTGYVCWVHVKGRTFTS